MPSAQSYATVSCQTDEPPQHINAGTDAPLCHTYTMSQCQTDAPPRCIDASTNAQSPSTRNTAHSQMEPIPADTQRHTESLSPARTAPRSQDPHGDVPPPHAERPSRSCLRRKHRMQSLRLPSEAPIDMESPHQTTSHPPYLRLRVDADSPIQDAAPVYMHNTSTDAPFDWVQDTDNTLPITPAVVHHPPHDFSSLQPSGINPWFGLQSRQRHFYRPHQRLRRTQFQTSVTPPAPSTPHHLYSTIHIRHHST